MPQMRVAEAEVRVRTPCPACDGTGLWPEHDDAETECAHCSGEGGVGDWVPLAELARQLAQAAGWWGPSAPPGAQKDSLP